MLHIQVLSGLSLLLFYIIGRADPSYDEVFGLVVGYTIIARAYVWNLITCCIFETHFLKVILDFILFSIIPSTTPIIALDQFLLYVLFNILACSLGTSLYCLIRFFSTGLENTVMEPIYGFSGILIPLFMYARQTLKNQPIHAKLPHINFQNISIVILSMQFIFWCCGLKFLHVDIPFTLISILFSWSYLRFYYKYPHGMGERDSELTFVAMFPEILLPIMVPLSTAFYNLFSMCGILPELESQPKYSQHHLRHDVESVAAPVDVAAERRRAKAMKVSFLLCHQCFHSDMKCSCSMQRWLSYKLLRTLLDYLRKIAPRIITPNVASKLNQLVILRVD